MIRIFTFLLLVVCSQGAIAQDSVRTKGARKIHEIIVNGYRPVSGMGYLNDVHDGIIYSGKKTELITLDSLNANTAQNNPRQVLGRIPGANFSETQYSGFPSNGIGFRGLNPAQSMELDTRQNGYNIAGDIYGYPESYYLPPLEAIEKIEVTRGASSLQFGPQFGGVINYLTKPASLKPIEFTTEQTGGSYGLYHSFNSITGTLKKWSYVAFMQYEGIQGWRPNSDLQQVTGFARIGFKASEQFKIGLEYSVLRNRLHMPGGLSDSVFRQDPRQSFRSRNWLMTPWNILALTAEYKIAPHSTLSLRSAFNFSARNIVWRNEDGGPQAADSIVDNNYLPREVEHEGFKSLTSELRLLTTYTVGGNHQSMASGVRVFSGHLNRKEGGPGSTGSGPDLGLFGGAYEKNLTFLTFNIAPYIENTFRIGNRFSITPGFRFEYLRSSANGHVTSDDGNIIQVHQSKPRFIPLAGLGIQVNTSSSTSIYGNISQAYRPIEYSFQYPLGLGVNAKIDPNLKDISGFNADLGWRGSISNFLNFDLGAFYMRKNKEIALETMKDPAGKSFTYETNVADAVHQGLETYIELNIFRLISDQHTYGSLSIFNSFSYDHATYINGLYKGNQSAFAPKTTERVGVTYGLNGFSTTFLLSRTAKSFSDASNTVYNINAETGIIPAFQVIDWSASMKIKNYKIKLGVNNLANEKYFTLRTNEYPGPGIIPSIGRSMYLGLSASF